MNTDQLQSTLLQALQEAGKILRQSYGQRRFDQKSTELSLVTETDKKAEQVVISAIKKNFPDHAILTEESPPQGSSASRWIIDPLDGTTNFAHTYPICAVSIAYEEDGRILTGGVYDPFRDELFLAQKGKGATLNGQPIRVSPNKTLSAALVATGFPYDRRERPDQYLAIVKDFMMEVHGIRRTGSASLDLCYVACGRFDGFWEFQLQPWDKAAGMLLIEEAGGKVTDYSGNPLTLESGQNLASNGLIHAAMIEVLKPYRNLKM